MEWKVTTRRAVKEKGFTLIQVVTTLALLLVLSTIAAFGYSEVVNRSYQKVCKANLEILTTAVELYSMENEALPATLGDLDMRHFDRAYAKVMGKDSWELTFARFASNLSLTSIAHAQFLSYENLRQLALRQNFTDPSDTNGGASYGINMGLAGKRWAEVGENEIVVADSDIYVFYDQGQLSRRHTKDLGTERLAMAMTKGKKVIEINGSAGTAHTPTNLREAVIYFDHMVITAVEDGVEDKAEDVRDRLIAALAELEKESQDTQAAKGNIEGAMADLQAMIDEGLIGQVEGGSLASLLISISYSL